MIRKDRISHITVELKEDPDDPEQLLLDLGTELCEQLGWQVGDSLTWADNGDGSWTLTKQQT
jgi:hypothetical protein